jgi:hypothetical protein
MAGSEKGFFGRFFERLLSWGDDERVNGVMRKTHKSLEQLIERVEAATPEVPDPAAAEPDPVLAPEVEAEGTDAPVKTRSLPPPPRKPAAATRSAARGRAGSAPAKTSGRTTTRSPAARKPRGAASEPTVEDAAAPKPEPTKTPRKKPALKAVPETPDTTTTAEPKKPRTRKAAAEKPKPAETTVSPVGIAPEAPAPADASTENDKT